MTAVSGIGALGPCTKLTPHSENRDNRRNSPMSRYVAGRAAKDRRSWVIAGNLAREPAVLKKPGKARSAEPLTESNERLGFRHRRLAGSYRPQVAPAPAADAVPRHSIF